VGGGARKGQIGAGPDRAVVIDGAGVLLLAFTVVRFLLHVETEREKNSLVTRMVACLSESFPWRKGGRDVRLTRLGQQRSRPVPSPGSPSPQAASARFITIHYSDQTFRGLTSTSSILAPPWSLMHSMHRINFLREKVLLPQDALVQTIYSPQPFRLAWFPRMGPSYHSR
jgi:hypothetical protein